MTVFDRAESELTARDDAHRLEIMVTLGRDSRVAYQNPASLALKARPLGAPLINVTDFFNAEEIRDQIYAGRNVRFLDQEIRIGRRSLWVTRLYQPLLDADGDVVGMISQGTSALRTGTEMLALRRLNRLIRSEQRSRRKRIPR